jgi:hypothetical protein
METQTMIEICKQKLSQREKECGIRCIDCDRLMTDDEFYCRIPDNHGIYKVICVNCGLKKAKL